MSLNLKTNRYPSGVDKARCRPAVMLVPGVKFQINMVVTRVKSICQHGRRELGEISSLDALADEQRHCRDLIRISDGHISNLVNYLGVGGGSGNLSTSNRV